MRGRRVRRRRARNLGSRLLPSRRRRRRRPPRRTPRRSPHQAGRAATAATRSRSRSGCSPLRSRAAAAGPAAARSAAAARAAAASAASTAAAAAAATAARRRRRRLRFAGAEAPHRVVGGGGRVARAVRAIVRHGVRVALPQLVARIDETVRHLLGHHRGLVVAPRSVVHPRLRVARAARVICHGRALEDRTREAPRRRERARAVLAERRLERRCTLQAGALARVVAVFAHLADHVLLRAAVGRDERRHRGREGGDGGADGGGAGGGEGGGGSGGGGGTRGDGGGLRGGAAATPAAAAACTSRAAASRRRRRRRSPPGC